MAPLYYFPEIKNFLQTNTHLSFQTKLFFTLLLLLKKENNVRFFLAFLPKAHQFASPLKSFSKISRCNLFRARIFLPVRAAAILEI